jgi:cytidylate kinase
LKIAIDGPAGSGKSTISKLLAEKFNLTYIDTGAMYRSCAYISKKFNLESQDLVNKIKDIEIILTSDNKVFLKYNNDLEDVSELIRQPEITNMVAQIAAKPEIRKIMTEKQKEIASKGNVIMDGRDIGTVVIPDADVKIFLTASDEERAKRRYDEWIKKGKKITFDEVFQEMKIRDEEDMKRQTAPLVKAKDAVELDTTGLNINEVVNEISKIIKEKGLV